MRQIIESLLRRKTLVNIGALFSGTAVARVLSAVGLMLIARQLGPGAFGQFAATLSLSKLTSVLFSWGLDTWLLRNGRNNEEYSLSHLSSACLELKVRLGALWFVSIVIVSFFLNRDVFPQILLILSAFSIWFDELSNTVWSAFKTALRNDITVWLMIGSQGLFFLITLLFIVTDLKNVQTYMAGRLAASILSSGVAVFFMARLLGVQFRFLPRKVILQDTIPFGMSQGLAVIYERADVIIIGYFLGKTAVGFYAPAVSLMTTLFMIPRSIYEVMLPITSEMYVKNPKAIVQHAYNIVLVSAGLGIVMGVGMAIIARPLVWLLYGSAYAISGDILTILSPILVIKSVSFALAVVLTAVGWQNRRVIVQLIAAMVNIGLNIYIVQSYELIGVAYVYILTESILAIGYMFYLLLWQHSYQVQLANSVKR